MIKFWTTKNGILGTAHRNRTGAIVDFRPASRIAGDGKVITIYPPKGQDGQDGAVKPLKLEVTRLEKRVIEPENSIVAPKEGQQRIEEVVFASFEGVEVSATYRKYAEWYDKAAEEADSTAKKKETARWQKERKEERDFLKNISFEDLASEVTTSELGKLRAGKLSAHFLLEGLLRRIMIAERARPDLSFIYDEVKKRVKETGYLDQFKADILAFDDRRKEERKQQWLAKEGQK